MLRLYEDGGLLEKGRAKGARLLDGLNSLRNHPLVGDVRGRGLMIGVEFVQDRDSKERAVALRDEIIQKAFRRGLLLIPCGANTIRLTPPLNISRELVDEGLQIFDDAIAATEKEFSK